MYGQIAYTANYKTRILTLFSHMLLDYGRPYG